VRARLIAVTALAAACFTYPLLSLFDRPVEVFGVPLVWAYLFVVWALLVVAVAVLSRQEH
jgi:lipopolysaccharide export LptBFGC system permease protein LptF